MSFRNSLLKVGCPTAKLTLPFPYQSRTKAPRWIPPNLTLTQTLTQVGIHRGGGGGIDQGGNFADTSQKVLWST